VQPKRLCYVARGWGVGELWVAEGRVFAIEHPDPQRDGRQSDDALARRLQAWFGGARDDFADVELDLEWCTPFERALLGTLRGVPAGETVSYGELAALAGRPRAARAAGTFCATNRFAVVVPCHRVVAAHGIGGYGSLGVAYKERLLALDARGER
jgi:methylated-DNA-[protein]-cysteine S-methyltransferase